MSAQSATINNRQRVAAAALLISLGACDREPASYFPLEPDRYWQYDVVRTTMDGSKNQKYLIETRAPREWNGATVHVRQTVDGHQFFYRRQADGINRVARKLSAEATATATEPAILVLPRAPAVGDSWRQLSHTAVLENTGPPWETLFRIMHPVELDFTVASTSDTVRVGAGNFSDCLRVVGHGRFSADVGNYIGRAEISVNVTEWYAPNVGLVRSERTETTNAQALSHGSIVMELASYR
jgi:hypothetical protein